MRALLLILFVSNSLFSQNLVPNGSFEIYNTCPYLNGQIGSCDGWYSPPIIYSTPDYFNVCDTTNAFGVPENFNGHSRQIAHTGNAYAGILCIQSFSDLREYIQVKLSQKLVNGFRYYVSFYVSLSEPSQYSISTIGAYLSKNDSIEVKSYMLDVQDYIKNENNVQLLDTSNWKIVQGSFIGKDDEEVLTIGNFKDDQNSYKTITGFGVTSASYYYIDDVCVSLNPTDCGIDTTGMYLGVEGEEKEVAKIEVFPNPAKDYLRLNYTIGDNSNLSSALENMLGQRILPSAAISSWGADNVNISGVANGVYLLKVMQHESIVDTRKIVINR